jgi:hypothetical protein
MCRTLTCYSCQFESGEDNGDKWMRSWAISDAVSTSIPPSDIHRFVRLFFADAIQGVQSVRPAHQGYHQIGGWYRSVKAGGTEYT